MTPRPPALLAPSGALLFLLLLPGGAWAARHDDLEGPGRSRLELYRPWPGADKLHVEVDLGDGTPRMMLLDSGAGITLVTAEVAAELGLVLSEQVDQYVQVSGFLEARSAVIPELRIGRHRLYNVKVAVPVRPINQTAGVPVAGLLGSNVLSGFQVLVDYPANRLELYRPGRLELPPDAAPMYFDGQHAMTAAVVVARRDGQTVEEEILVDIDTGARGLWLFGRMSDEFAALASEGLEPVVGVSALEGLPLRSVMRTTRRVPIVQVHAGGVVIERELDATWTAFDAEGQELVDASPGLLGHSWLDGYRALLDYPAQRFALMPPEKVRPENDIHAWRLQTLRRSREPDRLVRIAELQTWMGQLDAARESLERHHDRFPEDPEGAVFLARMRRLDGEVAEALGLLAGFTGVQLSAHGELVAQVDGLWLDGRAQEGLDLARQAVQEGPDDVEHQVALADARRSTGDLAGARAALVQANSLAENPDGNLLRRAWVAAEEGDRLAALTHLRRLLELEPGSAVTAWFYGGLVDSEEDRRLLERDLDRAVAALHPGEGALDFIASAYMRAGAAQKAADMARAGRTRDCLEVEEEASRLNCEAWYKGVVGAELDQALVEIQQAMALKPERSEFLDTLSVVLEARGDLQGARDASWKAAALSPDDVYLLWQAARLDRKLAGAHAALPAEARP